MELDPEARDVLSLAREARTPSAEDKARIERRLALAVGLTAATAVTVSTAPAAASTTVVAKAASGAALLKWSLLGGAVLAAAVASYTLRAPADRATHAANHSNAPTAVPAAATTALPVAATAPATAANVNSLAQAPTTSAAEPAAEAVRPTHHSPAHARAAGGDPLRDELELLHAAQSAWRAGDAARALALTVEHEKRHPHSALALERDALRVLALCDVGKAAEAKRLAHSWLTRAAGSPLRASIEASCALK